MNINTGWEFLTVGDLVRKNIIHKPEDGNHGEIHPKSSDFVEQGIPFIMASDINNSKIDLASCKKIKKTLADNLRKGFSKPGDVLLTHKATLGRTAIVGNLNVPYIMLTPQVTYYRVKDLTKLDNTWLKYYFDNPFFQNILANYGDSGSTRAYIGITAQLDLPIILPPLLEQHAIAAVLSSLDNKIDLLHRQNATLETMAESLFRQWFIVEAKEKWEEKPLSKIASFLNGLPCQKHRPQNLIERLPILKIRELSNGVSTDSEWASSTVPQEYIIKSGDVIFSWSGSLMVKIWNGEDCVLNQHLFKVTSNNYPKWFYYFWCKQHLREFIFISESKATTMGHIKRGDLDAAIVKNPENYEIDAMSNIIEPFLDKLMQNKSQIRTLEKLRDTLLPKLISGEVRVDF